MKPIETGAELTAKWKWARTRPSIIFIAGLALTATAFFVFAPIAFELFHPFVAIAGLFCMVVIMMTLTTLATWRAEDDAYRIRRRRVAELIDARRGQVSDRHGLALTTGQALSTPSSPRGSAVAPSTHPIDRAGSERIAIEVDAERDRALAKHGDKSIEGWPALALDRLPILTEETGEVAKEFNDATLADRPVDAGKLRAELLQVATVAIAWIDAIDRETTAG